MTRDKREPDVFTNIKIRQLKIEMRDVDISDAQRPGEHNVAWQSFSTMAKRCDKWRAAGKEKRSIRSRRRNVHVRCSPVSSSRILPDLFLSQAVSDTEYS